MVSKIRNIFLIAVTGILLVACGDKYEEPTDASFAGTWVYDVTYAYENGKATDTIHLVNTYIVIRDNMVLYYSKGIYDSSFLYRIEKANLYGTRIRDLARFTVDVPKIKVDSEGKPVYDENGELVYEQNEQGKIIYETITDYRPAKPTPPISTEGNLEKEIATFSFKDGKMILKYFKNLSESSDETKMIKQTILARPNSD